MSRLLLLLMLLSVLSLRWDCHPAAADPAVFGMFKKVHVHVYNKLSAGQSMQVRCRSGDDDLGERTVEDGGELTWSFGINFGGTTLFYCDVWWDGKPGGAAFRFDAYDHKRDDGRCRKEVLWTVAREGVYSHNTESGLWEYFYQY